MSGDLDLEERYRRVLRRLPSWPDDGPSHSVPSPGRSAGSERYQSREQGRGQSRGQSRGRQAHVTYLTAKQAIGLSRGKRQN